MKDEGHLPVVKEMRLGPVIEADVDDVIKLASEVWWHHYPDIISPAQIEYMLRQRYDPALIRDELLREDIWWNKLVAGDALVAFSSCILVEAATMKLDKLYVHPAHQRTGCGGILIAQVCRRARERGCRAVILAVNKRNASAIAAYERHGFQIRESLVTDIGGGFVMDDYVMARQP